MELPSAGRRQNNEGKLEFFFFFWVETKESLRHVRNMTHVGICFSCFFKGKRKQTEALKVGTLVWRRQPAPERMFYPITPDRGIKKTINVLNSVLPR